MDLFSYLLGKNSSQGGGGGVDIKDYFYESTSVNSAYKLIKKLPSFEITGTSLSQFFNGLSELLEISPIDTKDVTDFSYMVNGCTKLTTIPIFDLSSATNIQSMFGTASDSLSDESLNNIMLSCIGINPEYSGTKSLQYVGLWSTSRNKCKDLPAYQDFLDAGWTLTT